MTSIGIIRITRKYGSGARWVSSAMLCVVLVGVAQDVKAQPPKRPDVGEAGATVSAGGRASGERSESSAGPVAEGNRGVVPSSNAATVSSLEGGVSGVEGLDPEAVVRRAIWQAVWGEPIASRVRQKISMFGKELVGVGSYCHAGKGTSKLKWQMRFASAEAVTNYLQISDGRLLWTSQQVNERIEVNRVDLDPIRERIGVVRESDLSNPLLAMELAIGGQAELLRSLYHRYDWETAVPAKLDQQPVWLLTGEIRKMPPIPAARAPIDQAMQSASQTGLLPERVRLALGRTEQYPFFLHRIEYFKKKEADGNTLWEPITVIEFFEVSAPEALEPELFQYEVRDTVEAIQDDTSKYLPASPLHLTRQPDLKTR